MQKKNVGNVGVFFICGCGIDCVVSGFLVGEVVFGEVIQFCGGWYLVQYGVVMWELVEVVDDVVMQFGVLQVFFVIQCIEYGY